MCQVFFWQVLNILKQWTPIADLASFQCGLCATPHIRDLLFAREMITASDNTVLLFSGPALRQ